MATARKRNYKQGYVRLSRKLKGRLSDLALEVYGIEKAPAGQSLAAEPAEAESNESSGKNSRTYSTTPVLIGQSPKAGNLAQHFDDPPEPRQVSMFDGLESYDD